MQTHLFWSTSLSFVPFALGLSLGLGAATLYADDAHSEIFAYKSVFTHPPMPLPRYQQLDAPLLGNGDIAVAMSGDPNISQFPEVVLAEPKLLILRCMSGPRPLGHLDLLIPQLQWATYHVEQRLADATTLSTIHGPGYRVQFIANGKSAQVLEGDRFTFKTAAGDHFELSQVPK